ncbi:dynein regulatory complex protein 10 isoform X2 [Toxotes jaculatrix]|uniref:dynein regulatory complex protein 10 isoform X2 n=1 Tax=Toxotes jaculatrix TaxID=941984 RepID=UPI001B3ABFE2|nr:dynein regulatory complex protein 10 isoform X2 [Toxotes jaculatrix]
MSAKGATVLSKTKSKAQSKDPLKNHDPSQKHLLTVEAQRISSILENCISQIVIAGTLPAILRLNSVSNVVNEELSRALKKHQLLVERLETLEVLKQESEREDGEARKRARAQIEKDIKKSVRDLFRLFRAHPDVVSSLRAELGEEVGESEFKLIRGLKMFHSHMVEKLLTSVDEELQMAPCKSAFSFAAQDLEHMLLQKEAAAKKEIDSVDSQISQKKNKIKNLQNSLQGSNITQESGMPQLAVKQCQPHFHVSKKQISMQQEIDQLNIQLNNLILENRQAERVLQEADLELNEIDHEREEEELRKMEKPFTVLEMEYSQIQERRRLAEEKREREMRELELKTKAAIFAQAWWRGYSTRKALKNKGKSKKAKKDKGKRK